MVDPDRHDDGNPEDEDQLENPVILRHRRVPSRRHPRLEFFEPVLDEDEARGPQGNLPPSSAKKEKSLPIRCDVERSP